MRQVEPKQVYVMDGDRSTLMDKVHDHCENKAEKFIRHLLSQSGINIDTKYSNKTILSN